MFSSKFSIFYQVYVIMNTIKINVMSVILHEQIFCNKAGIGNHLHSCHPTNPIIFRKTRQISVGSSEKCQSEAQHIFQKL